MAKQDVYLEVWIANGMIFISDWSYMIESHFAAGRHKEGFSLLRDFVKIEGKEINYWINGIGMTYDERKRIAIYYHTSKANKSISKYRLD